VLQNKKIVAITSHFLKFQAQVAIKTLISSLKMDGKLYCDPVTKSNILNRQFKSAFSEFEEFPHGVYIAVRVSKHLK
jgi:hypothetical protein